MSGSLMGKNQIELEEQRKQGIVSILGSDTGRTSLRRTLSAADMSSGKWLSRHGLSSSPMKKIASSEELSNCLDGYAFEEEEKVNEKQQGGQFDIWSSIMSQKGEGAERDRSAPYVHPLVKRLASCLSEKSLEVCTESLGSETGSDGFSSCPSSESSDSEEEQQQNQHTHQHECDDYEDVRVEKYNFTPVGKRLSAPSFPPPLPSLTSRRDGPSLQMRPHRQNGRLVLEAVSVSKQNNFIAERHDGRLVLTFLNPSSKQQQKEAQLDQEIFQKENAIDEVEEYEESETDDEDKNKEESETSKEIEITLYRAPNMTSLGAIKLHRLALVINKPKNPTSPHKFNETVAKTLTQNLPPRPPTTTRLTTTTSFNAYEYCWRSKPTTAQAMEKNNNNKYIISKNNSSIISNNYTKQELVVIPNLKGCKEHKRSIFQEPYCIATS